MAPPEGNDDAVSKEINSKEVAVLEVVNRFKLSKRELEVALYAWQCIEGDNPKIDYAKLMTLADFNNVGGASKQWSLTRIKLKVGSSSNTSATPRDDNDDSTPDTPKAGGASKRKRTVKADGEAGMPLGSTAKKGRRLKKEVEPESEADEDDDSFIVNDTPGSAVKASWKPAGDDPPPSPTPVRKKRGRPSKKDKEAQENGSGGSAVDNAQEKEVPLHQEKQKKKRASSHRESETPADPEEQVVDHQQSELLDHQESGDASKQQDETSANQQDEPTEHNEEDI
ncbi:hypothetical protein BD289DRAFT_474541 [Coniella lustricola]|uniref:Uncharacterized protein n=1 Tax=Coniella lustricola TaxID=2025994 RepID=A0A2T3A6V0_9PEZI|nr:hypothetical protein BD289DRAFT_474541 [Coniella lustricola]